MPTVAQRIFEDPISHSQDEAPLDAYSPPSPPAREHTQSLSTTRH